MVKPCQLFAWVEMKTSRVLLGNLLISTRILVMAGWKFSGQLVKYLHNQLDDNWLDFGVLNFEAICSVHHFKYEVWWHSWGTWVLVSTWKKLSQLSQERTSSFVENFF